MINNQKKINRRFVLRKGTVYGLVALISILGYALIVSGFSLIVSGDLSFRSPIIAGTVFFLIAVLFESLRIRIEEFVNDKLFIGKKVFQEVLHSYTNELVGIIELDSILKKIRETIFMVFRPSVFHIYIFDPLSEQYIAWSENSGNPSSDLRFNKNGILPPLLEKEKGVLPISKFHKKAGDGTGEVARVKLLNSSIFIPLHGRNHLSGWIAIEKEQATDPFSKEELEFLDNLGDQSSLAIERAQVVNEMEEKVREMDVLARIAKGINVTLEKDDILELIFAQTTQVIPADDFHIFLVDETSKNLEEIFCVIEKERLVLFENELPQASQTREREVLETRKGLIRNNLSQHIGNSNEAFEGNDIWSWMGVPLNAGADVIGVLSLGSRRKESAYSEEQLHLLQSIADQAAGALIKAKLFEESQHRALQMSILNEASQKLTSTLEIEPLLENILKSAVEMLDSETGSLLLVDDVTDELEYRFVIGPDARDLKGKKISKANGVIGEAVTYKKGITVNKGMEKSKGISELDIDEKLHTTSVLIIPLIVKENVIGVFEIINKNDKSAFTKGDEQLLTAYSAQAAIAIENAELYTMTDKKLADRIEELSIMQRITRELNNNLDMQQAMEITLNWTKRRSGADAVLIGVVQDDQVKLVASQGYSTNNPYLMKKLIPVGSKQFSNAIDSGKVVQIIRSRSKSEYQEILKNSRTKVVIPIRRETRTIGVIILEYLKGYILADELIKYLVRLADYSASALSNTQLYAAVQEANEAKSEFVSFVSHELKNPMTSIKGYTELLSAGAVGPINESQSNFLKTIQSNVERMTTLVSDLADDSRIEAGKIRLELAPQNVREIIEEVLRSMSAQIETKGQQIVFQCPETMASVFADRMRLNQILTNLVSNAHKYTEKGGMIEVACEESKEEDGIIPGNSVHFWVKDSGIGITEDDQQKIFSKFFRSEDSKTREETGTGLGLNITKRLVELQGGKIWYESEFREGTVFHFTIPIAFDQ
ncbi:MAG: GAF domain-containing protein [Anaerolineaceae bacterium]|nr:GAF domain-containing protein [Anaerolineaceae bacterium]